MNISKVWVIGHLKREKKIKPTRIFSLRKVYSKLYFSQELVMQNSDILSLAHLRTDGRRYDELRTIKHKLSLFNGSDGSAYLEQGNLT
jgi:hypothetical protein